MVLIIYFYWENRIDSRVLPSLLTQIIGRRYKLHVENLCMTCLVYFYVFKWHEGTLQIINRNDNFMIFQNKNIVFIANKID